MEHRGFPHSQQYVQLSPARNLTPLNAVLTRLLHRYGYILSKLSLLSCLAAAGKPTAPSLFGNDPFELSYDVPNRDVGVEGEKAGLEELDEPLAA